MKVCLFNDSFPPLIDGVVNTVVNYAMVIQKKYGDVLVATPKYPGVTDNYPFEVLRYPSINTVRMVGYRTATRLTRRQCGVCRISHLIYSIRTVPWRRFLWRASCAI